MLNLKQKHYAERIQELIAEGETLANNPQVSKEGYKIIGDNAKRTEWLSKVENIIETTFGKNSSQFRLNEKLSSGKTHLPTQINKIVGLLRGGLSDLEGGYLVSQEFLIAGEIYATVLEQAKDYFYKPKDKNVAAMLCRTVLEDGLKRMARKANLNDKPVPAKLNEKLCEKGLYKEHLRRSISAWIKIGNSAAHGDFNDYDDNHVKTMLEGIEHFFESEFGENP
ncbi:MAG: hypothetical protein DRR08_11835 [Candidatus Parabeggiatoa sp. nov. 2]|nr:MAG: hypothetical protein B6247_08655 [Beggiatoa sp. 4572_84]RKZ60253.1 MAG: hypothetical protein DRR08_11835 [Gammaproteobacteria bacterium]